MLKTNLENGENQKLKISSQSIWPIINY